jgi:hypothetical protein
LANGASYAVFLCLAVSEGCGSGAPLKPEGGVGGSGGSAAMTTTDGAALTCGDLLGAIKEKLSHAVTSADRTCETVADCTAVGIGNLCYGDPCSPVFVSRAGAAVITAALTDIEVHDCDAVEKARCVSRANGPSYCPAEGVPVCMGGLCQNGWQLDAAAVDSALLCGGVACLAEEHLDTHSCKCVTSLPQDAGPTELAPPVECGGLLCPVGDRLDLTRCKCVNTFDANFCFGVECRPDYHFNPGLCECLPNASSDASSADASSSDASLF